MANVQHSSLTDSDGIHEPKGISSATSNQIYLSNGSGSGNWRDVSRTPGTGWGKYTNQNYVGTTAFSLPANAETVIPFDTASIETDLPISLSGTTTSLMNLTNNKLQFINEGDLHSLTFTAEIYSFTPSGSAPSHLDVLLYGSSDGSTYNTELGESTVSLVKGSGQVITETALFPVTANMVTYGAKIKIRIPNTGTSTNIINIGLITARVHKARF